MILTAEQVKSIAKGYLGFEAKDDGCHFYRFTDWQMKYYEETNAGHFMKTKATSGIHLDFTTDSDAFGFSYTVTNGSSRNFYFFDIYVDGVLTLHRGEEKMWIKKGEIKLKLPAGAHRVTVWMPNLACAVINDVTLDDGASFEAVKETRRMLCYGDSISQGYDAIFPSLAYTNQLARHFDAYMVNQCIGGERFVPALLDQPLDFKPDIVTVAYGTNDWSGLTREVFFANCDAFLERLTELYGNTAEIFVITPLWRGDKDKVTKFGNFFEAVKYIADKASSLGVHVIDGYVLTPHTSEFYSDLRLHPNDLGYMEYASRLIPEMEKLLGKGE